MPADKLGIKERAALLTLMAQAREVSNPELEEIAGFRLDGKERTRLNALRLVESRRDTSQPRRPYLHTLTAEGWAWCAAELSSAIPARSGSAGGALYAVLAGLQRHLARTGLDLRHIFGSAGDAPLAPDLPPPPDLPDRIQAAYRKLARDPGDPVSLTELRPLLGTAPRAAVDATLRQLSRARRVNLVPQANQKILSQADRAAAVRIGNEDCHFVAMERT